MYATMPVALFSSPIRQTLPTLPAHQNVVGNAGQVFPLGLQFQQFMVGNAGGLQLGAELLGLRRGRLYGCLLFCGVLRREPLAQFLQVDFAGGDLLAELLGAVQV